MIFFSFRCFITCSHWLSVFYNCSVAQVMVDRWW
nr:MAG TPA: hypothetical protein [Caudoviricetes sp.]